MVRNLMMIAGLTLAVSAFGCSDDDKGTGGTGGGTPGPVIPPACDNTDDIAAIAGGELQDALAIACGAAGAVNPDLCSPDSSGMNTCLETGNGGATDGTTLSEACSSCYADLTCCGLAECSITVGGPCAGPPEPGDACDVCTQDKCGAAFATCGGGAGGSGGSGGAGGSGGSGGAGGSGGSGGS